MKNMYKKMITLILATMITSPVSGMKQKKKEPPMLSFFDASFCFGDGSETQNNERLFNVSDYQAKVLEREISIKGRMQVFLGIIYSNNTRKLTLLLEALKNKFSDDDAGWALEYASRTYCDIAIMKILIKKFTISYDHANMALQYASNGYFEKVKVIIKAFKSKLKNYHACCAQQYALKKGHPNIANYIKKEFNLQ